MSGTWRSRIKGGALAPLVGGLLVAPAVGRARVLDDHVLELLARGGDAALGHAQGADLFRFASGEAAANLRLMASGSLLPWWADTSLHIEFFRPLSSLAHRLDYALWAERPELMYVHSLLWYVLLLVLVRRLYASFECREQVQGLAAWLYCVNDAHATTVSWLSNRNALLSAVGVVLTLSYHVRARREGHGPSRWLAPLCLAGALLAGELGLAAWAFLIPHALLLDRGSLAKRCAGLWALAAVTLAWAAAYAASGAATSGSGVYLHPLVEPSAFLRALPERLGVLLGAALGPMPADVHFWGSLGGGAVAAAAAPALAVLAWGLCRHRQDQTLRFWCAVTLLALLPVASSFPSDRLLLLVNVGAMAIVSRVICDAGSSARPASRVARAAAAALLLVHGVLAPLLAPLRAQQMQALAGILEHAFQPLQEIEDLQQKTLIFLGAPADFFVSYLQVERAARRLPRPAQVYWLANPGAALDVRVVGAHTLEVRRAGGFFSSPPEALYRSPRTPLALGDSVQLPELSAHVTALDPSGLPGSIELRFSAPLAAERYVFFELQGRSYRRVTGASLAHHRVEPASPLSELLAKALTGALPEEPAR